MDADLIEAITDLADLLESLRHPKHATTLDPLRAKLSKMLTRRFHRQQGNLLHEAQRWLPWLAKRYSEAETDEATRKAALTHTIQVNIDAGTTFTTDASAADIAVFNAAVDAAVAGAMQTISVDLAIAMAKDQAKTFTAKWLTTSGFKKLAADVDNTTRENIASAVADTFVSGGSYDDAVQAIKDAFSNATNVRADLIARTEMNDVYNAALLSSAKEGTDLLKTWRADGECCEEICQPNVDAGPIELDEDFPSGDQAPTGHPRCDCSLGFVRRDEAG